MTRRDLTEEPSVPRRLSEYVNTDFAIAATDWYFPFGHMARDIERNAT